MKRDTRAALARETVQICEQAHYRSPRGTVVDISAPLAQARNGTVLYSPERAPTLPPAPPRGPTILSARNETTFEGLARLATGGGHVVCLNFASAKNPGGGFLNGSSAQEESLARSSGLYPCLLAAPEYYARNRAHGSAIYLDFAIFSPNVPFFRDDAGALLETPVLGSVITAPAPNAGAVGQNEPANLPQVEPSLRRRMKLVLEIARAHQIEKLVLGAWGCGVFRNDPRIVAHLFAEFLKPPGEFSRAFAEVVFSVFDRSEKPATYQAFEEQFGGGDR